MGTNLFFRSKTIFANNVLIYFFNLAFRNLKFPELENWELKVPENTKTAFKEDRILCCILAAKFILKQLKSTFAHW